MVLESPGLSKQQCLSCISIILLISLVALVIPGYNHHILLNHGLRISTFHHLPGFVISECIPSSGTLNFTSCYRLKISNNKIRMRYCCWVTQLCHTLCDPIGCSLPGFSVREILQARPLEWVAISFCRRSSWLRDWSCVFCGSCIAGGFFTTKPPGKPNQDE